jgi:hypothetical protein
MKSFEAFRLRHSYGEMSTEHMSYAVDVTHVFVYMATKPPGWKAFIRHSHYLEFGTSARSAGYFTLRGGKFSWAIWIPSGVIGGMGFLASFTSVRIGNEDAAFDFPVWRRDRARIFVLLSCAKDVFRVFANSVLVSWTSTWAVNSQLRVMNRILLNKDVVNPELCLF